MGGTSTFFSAGTFERFFCRTICFVKKQRIGRLKKMNPTANQVEFESGHSFAQQLRGIPKKTATAAVTNRFDQISKDDALAMLRGSVTEGDARLMLTDPRMTLWMKKHNVDPDAATLDRMIHNRLVPNVRKITQNAYGHGAILAKHIGADIQWQPKTTVEADAFATPDERRLPYMVGQGGKGSLPSHVQSKEYYSDKVGKYLNNVNPIEQVTVGRGISADSGMGMNLHYGSALTAQQLVDPGQQRSINTFREVDLVNPLAYAPTPEDMVRITAPGENVLTATKDERINTSNLEKFTAKEYTETVAPRRLTDILLENQFELERTPGETLLGDERVFQTPVTPFDPKFQSRPTENTHDVSLKTTELKEPAGPGKNLKAALDFMEQQFIAHPMADPNRSNHSVLIPSEQRFAATYTNVTTIGQKTSDDRKLASDVQVRTMESNNVFRSISQALQQFELDASVETKAHVPRRQLDGPFDPRASHGGTQEAVLGPKEFGARTKEHRGVRGENLLNPSGVGKKISDTRNFGETTIQVQLRPDNAYVTPGSNWKRDAAPVRPGTNANGKAEVRAMATDAPVRGNLTTSAARPILNGQEVTTRKLEMGRLEEPGTIDIILSQQRNKATTSTVRVQEVGEDTTVGRRKSIVIERAGTAAAAPPTSTALAKKILVI
jgi:hypothetical protein